MLENCLLDPEVWSGTQKAIQLSLDAHNWVEPVVHFEAQLSHVAGQQTGDDTGEAVVSYGQLSKSILTSADIKLLTKSVSPSQAGSSTTVKPGKSKKSHGAGAAGPGERLVTCGPDDTYLCYPEKIANSVVGLFLPGIQEKADSEGPSLLKQLKAKDTQSGASKSGGGGADDDDDWGSGKKKKGGKKGAKGGSKKDGNNNKPNADGDALALDYMSPEEMVTFLTENWSISGECPPTEVLDEVSELLMPVLNAKFRECLESVFLSTESGGKQSLKRSHAEFEERYRNLYERIYMFDTSGVQAFDDSTADQLRTLLFKGPCTDLMALAVCYVSNIDFTSNQQLTPKIRDTSIDSLPPPAKETFQQLVTALAKTKADDLSEFYTAAENVAGLNLVGIKGIKPPDKRRRPKLVADYLAELEAQISQTDSADNDAAVRDLVALALIMFSNSTTADEPSRMLLASGKFMPQIVTFIRGKIPAEVHQCLSLAQSAVLKALTEKDPEAKAEMNKKVIDSVSELKQRVLENKS